jgi:hypothetical protein
VISPILFVIVGVSLYVYPRRYGGSSRPRLWGGWQTPPRWARAVFGSTNDQILVNDALIESVGIVWAVTGCVLMAIGPLPGTPTFSGVTIALTVVFLAGCFGAVAVWVAREVWHR